MSTKPEPTSRDLLQAIIEQTAPHLSPGQAAKIAGLTGLLISRAQQEGAAAAMHATAQQLKDDAATWRNRPQLKGGAQAQAAREHIASAFLAAAEAITKRAGTPDRVKQTLNAGLIAIAGLSTGKEQREL